MYLHHPHDRLSPATGAMSLAPCAAPWVTDLGREIGSARWWRGVVTCIALIAAAWLLVPPFGALRDGIDALLPDSVVAVPADAPAAVRPAVPPASQVRPLVDPVTPGSIAVAVTLGSGDSLTQALQRAGVGRDEAARGADTIADAVALSSLKPGIDLSLTLGRRPSAVQPRPVERLAVRVALDLELVVTRAGGAFALERRVIALDRTPLHVRGTVGQGLRQSLAGRGVPDALAEAYVAAIAAHVSIGSLAARDTFDLVADQARAATGEVEPGALQYAGLERAGRSLRLVRWPDGDGEDGAASSFVNVDRPGSMTRSGAFARPVLGHVTSAFGWRFHPLLGFTRFHQGLDIGAAYGSPIIAPADGVVAYAGRRGGYGNFVRLVHGRGVATGYGHMSRIAVDPGERVRRGQVIGYVGSTGLSTGPHLHWEVSRNGVAVDPARFAPGAVVPASPEALRAIRAKLADLLAVPAR